MSMSVEMMSSSLKSITAKPNPYGRDEYEVKVARDAWLEANGWKAVGRGAFKTVWAKPDSVYVVKTFAGEDGTREVRNFESAPEHIQPYLLPIMSHGPGFALQRRVHIDHADGYAGDWDKRKEICKEHGCPGWFHGVSDSGPNNHMHRPNGRVVIFDYGQSHQWDKAAAKKYKDEFIEQMAAMHPREGVK